MKFLVIKAMCVKLCRRISAKVESEEPKSILDKTSMTTLNFDEPESPLRFQKSDEIERPTLDIADAVARRVKLP